ncbi:MAG: PD-(D/E)XK nuclease family protein [Muribaculaceae bacterium]|nr:PD-(D/E)XK nuclease family protein [Muribaculaceae bacterium]MDE6643776.1 PD-(D/E)XK nuclease family protein [Muribaculaceae bacterium]
MEPFLKQIATLFAKKDKNLIDTCFVFPNKRSIAFFTEYLKELLPENTLMPEMTDIDSLVMSVTKSVVTPRIEQLFILFNCYTKLRKQIFPDTDESIISFDSFMTWGEMVLNDFNDVDRYLVDTIQIFRNIKYFKEIAANFLTENQVNIINRYWRDEITFDPDAPMWRHVPHESKDIDTVQNFFSIWVILDKLYHEFNAQLDKQGKTYSGAAYRRAAQILKESFPSDILHFKKYIFVGFNILSKSEIEIFKALQKDGIADFYWDNASPIFGDALPDNLSSNPATRYIKEYVKQFPTIGEPLPYQTFDKWPEIKIIGVPSNIGQVKKAAQIIDELLPEYKDKFDAIKARKTAVVLPDETLCIPLVNSLSDKVEKINITMGYSVKNSPVSSLMTNIIRLQSRSRFNTGGLSFYFEDVIALLSHPVLKTSYPDKCDNIIKHIKDNSIFNISKTDLIELFPEIEPFLIEPTGNLTSLKPVRRMLEALKELAKEDNLSKAFVVSYLSSLDILEKHIDKYNLVLTHDTVYQLLQRLAGGEAVHFKGEPLEGIQIMGLLETRALDFENLILLSMNEKVFPKTTTIHSFIPADMRIAYEMSTVDHQESIFAYYFYRLLTRCNKVFLIYDTRGGNNSAEMSRYIYQLIYAFPSLKPEIEENAYKLTASAPREIEVRKTPEIMEKLNLFRTDGSEKYLSASSINTYINCPLQFYLKNIGGFAEEEDLVNYIDDSHFGTIIHDVFEKLYLEESNKSGNNRFDAIRINQIKNTKEHLIEHLVVCAFKEHYLKQNPENFQSEGYKTSILPGEVGLLAKIVLKYILKILQSEADWKDAEYFNFKGAEQLIKGHVKFTNKVSLNIKGYIDRVDEIMLPQHHQTPVLRLVDYKTGNEMTKITGIEDMFTLNSNAKRAKGMLQLMIYCNAYAILNKYNKPIIPLIFNFNEMIKNGIDLMSNNKQPISNYQDINDEFIEKFEEVILEMFNPDEPFRQAENKDHACHYCDFKGICDIATKKSY